MIAGKKVAKLHGHADYLSLLVARLPTCLSFVAEADILCFCSDSGKLRCRGNRKQNQKAENLV